MRKKTDYTKERNPKGSKKHYVDPKKEKKRGFKEASLDSEGRSNDPNWYFVSSELAQQASQLSFQNIVGYGSIANYKIPSVVVFRTMMSPGETYECYNASQTPVEYASGTTQSRVGIGTGRAGVNLMASKLYALLSSFTGRTSAYAPQDVAMMILAISSIAEISEAIRRAFGFALTYNFRNRSLPLGIIRAMGFKTDTFVNNLAPYRMRFNVAMSRINQIPLLDNIGFIKKCRDIYQSVYQDDGTSMSQIFLYMPRFAYILDEQSSPSGTVLRAIPFTDKDGMTDMFDALSILEGMIDAVLNSSSLNLIYADLLNMANKVKTPTWQFDYLAENYVVMPKYDRTALLQLHNLTVMGDVLNPTANVWNTSTGSFVFGGTTHSVSSPSRVVTDSGDIWCDTNKNDVLFNPAFEITRGSTSYNAPRPTFTIVDMDTDNPTIEDRIESLRFNGIHGGNFIKAADVGATGNNMYSDLCAISDHPVLTMDIYSNIPLSGSISSARTTFDTSSEINGNQQFSSSILSRILQINNGPIFLGFSASSTLQGLWGDLKYYTTVDYDYVNRVNNCMMTGLFDFRV